MGAEMARRPVAHACSAATSKPLEMTVLSRLQNIS